MSAHDDLDRLDRELRAALTVDPSPAFLPGVRARAAEVRPKSPWHGEWFIVPVAVAAAAVLLVIAPREPEQALTRAVQTAAVPPAQMIQAAPLAALATTTVARSSTRRMARPANSRRPEVIVAEAEKAAWFQFMEMAGRGLIPAEPPAVTMQPLDIGDLTIAPLSGSEGV